MADIVENGMAYYWLQFGVDRRGLMEAAKEYRGLAYAPYSKFPVGAAILLDDGRIVGGCNVENASYGLSLCAERVAMASAITGGKCAPLAVAVAGPEGVFCSPCGACRQFLSEFNREMEVVLVDGGELLSFALDELLPHGFRLGHAR